MTETKEQSIQKCERQLEGLFIHLGSIVYGKAAAGEITIRIDPQEKKFQKELEELFQKVREHMPQPPEPEVAEPVPPQAPVNRRGSLAPYVDLNIELHEAKKKFVNLREDVDSCLPIASLHLSGEDRAKTDQFLDQLTKAENTINVLFEKVAGSVRQVMGMKKEAMDKDVANAYTGISNDEKKFLGKTEVQIHDMAHGVGTLVDEAKTLFESIKSFYEKDAAVRLETRPVGTVEPEEDPGTVAVSPAPALDEEEMDSAEEDEVGAPEMVAEEDRDDAGSLEQPGAEEEGVGAQEMVDEDEDRDDAETGVSPEASETEAVVSKQAAFDESILRAAERKLLSEHIDEKEQFHILMTLFRSMDAEIMVDFLTGFLERAPVIVKMNVLDLVTKVDHPGLEKVFEKFLSSPEALLRFKGIVGYGKLRPEVMNSLMLRASGDEDPSIRRLAANCLRPEDGHAEFTTIVKLSNDPEDQVARVAIRKLATCRTLASFSYLIPKLWHANPKMRREANDALKLLTGKDFGYRATAPEKERERAAKAWEKFLVKNQARPQLWDEGRKGAES